jgi:hypothetical protein
MANGRKAIERNEEPEISVYRRSVSNRLRPQHAFAGWLGRFQLHHPGPGEPADHRLRLLVANTIILLRL